MGDAHMGLQARLMSQALRKLTAIVSRSKTCFVFVNQIRQKIGFFLGSPETTSGGRALKFYSSLRIDVRRIAALKDGDQVIGNRVKVKIVKNKMAPPFREAQFDIIYGEGISSEGDLVDCGVDTGIVEKTGTWYSYKGERLGQGRENVKKLLKENTELAGQLDKEIRQMVGLLPGEEKEGKDSLMRRNPKFFGLLVSNKILTKQAAEQLHKKYQGDPFVVARALLRKGIAERSVLGQAAVAVRYSRDVHARRGAHDRVGMIDRIDLRRADPGADARIAQQVVDGPVVAHHAGAGFHHGDVAAEDDGVVGHVPLRHRLAVIVEDAVVGP